MASPSVSSLFGRQFYSFNELRQFLLNFEQENFVKLYISDSRTLENHVKRGFTGQVNMDLVYYEIRYRCIHGGRRKSTSTGLRPNQSTLRQGCPFTIRLRSQGNSMEVVQAVENHNHSVQKESADGKIQMKRIPIKDLQQMKKHKALPDSDKRKDLPHPYEEIYPDLLKSVAADCPEDSTVGSNDSVLKELEAIQSNSRLGMTELDQQTQNLGYTTDSTATTSNMISVELETTIPEQSMTSKKGMTEIGQLEKNEVHPRLKNMCYPLILSILNKETVVEIFTDFNIVPSETPPPDCGICGSPTKVIKRGGSFLGFEWYCTHKNIKNKPCQINPIQNTILEKTQIEIEDLMFIMIGFAWNETISFVHTHLDHFKISRGLPRTTPRVYQHFQKLEKVVEIFASYGVTIIEVNPKELDVQLHIFLQSVAAVYPGPGKTGLQRLTVNKHVIKTKLSKDVQDIMEKCSKNTLKTSGNSRKKSKHQSPQKKIKKRKSLKMKEREESWTSEDSDSEGKNSKVKKHKAKRKKEEEESESSEESY